ncbi:MAG: hypothetical protein JNL01_14475 [Bdellovibrionales bacterium]|nr:hypothetical protein [Bdellovibrionales bacterium]
MLHFVAFSLGVVLRILQDFHRAAGAMVKEGKNWKIEFFWAVLLYLGALVLAEIVGYQAHRTFWYRFMWAGVPMAFVGIIWRYGRWILREIREADLILPTVVLWYSVLTSWSESGNWFWKVLSAVFLVPSGIALWQIFHDQALRADRSTDWVRRGLIAWYGITQMAFAFQLFVRSDILGHFADGSPETAVQLFESGFYGFLSIQWMVALLVFVRVFALNRKAKYKEDRDASQLLISRLSNDQVHPMLALILVVLNAAGLGGNYFYHWWDEGFLLGSLWTLQPVVLKYASKIPVFSTALKRT